MGKGKIILIVLLCLVVLLAAGAFVAYRTLTGSTTRTAFISTLAGNVEVDSGSGWTAAQPGQKLSLDDKVRTNDGTAVIVLQESVIVRLEAKTEISIAELSSTNVKVKQASGTTWNKFTALSGVENYAVETPTTVATVRGTGFFVKDGGSELLVSDGSVGWSAGAEEKAANALQKLEFKEGAISAGILTQEEKQSMKKQIENDIREMKQLRWDELNIKHPKLYSQAKSKFNFTDEQVQEFFDMADRGEVDFESVKKNVPFDIDAVSKIEGYSTAIKKDIALLKTFG